MSDVAIRANNLCKVYHVYVRPRDRLMQMVAGWRRNYFTEFSALHNASFEIMRGEAVGIIGRNGGGKSTLLQIIAGTLYPSSGTAEVRGRIAALLELGSGFNPEFSGRENVYLNGKILGLSKQEIDDRFNDIVDFSEIADFIDRPVKTYSSGMFVRLAFSVQVFSQPEILIVDEALSVGDVFFQQKCFNHIRELQRKGTTLLFVSHDMVAVRNICTRALLMNHGHLEFDGAPEEAVSRYYALSNKNELIPRLQDVAVPILSEEGFADVIDHDILGSARSSHGEGKLKIVAASISNGQGQYGYDVLLMGEIKIRMIIQAFDAVKNPTAGIHLYDRMNNLVFAAGTRQVGVILADMVAGDKILLEISLAMQVQPGEYTFSLGCSEPSPEHSNMGINHDRYEGLGPINVFIKETGVMPFYGIAQLPIVIKQLQTEFV
jgi:ABC-type polysaccharide/polyol phosphate transport system ATPase subunit